MSTHKSEPQQQQIVAFRGPAIFKRGTLAECWPALSSAILAGQEEPILVFDAQTGQVVDIDPTRAPETRPQEAPAPRQAATPKKQRGRPRLGVVAREVTLLPQHWAWLAEQHGGASAALRRLINEKRLSDKRLSEKRWAELPHAKDHDQKTAAYRFMNAIAGNLPGFEEALRSLFAGDAKKFAETIAPWPKDIRDETLRLASPAQESASA